MFIDTAKITVKGGNGGRGCKSFYRDKYSRQGIANGGSGGKGADIVIRADRNLHTLMDFQFNRHFFGKHGVHGSSNNKTGANAERVVIKVPCGTRIRDTNSDSLLRDLKLDEEEVIVAKGGRGGRGNWHNQEATDGQPGEEKLLLLDLSIIADVGVVGFPNAGKSTLISAISNATPKIANYPFTTKFPILGVVGKGGVSFVVADIPGLIEGSSQGKGLGDQFLRHIERTKILIHLIDMSGQEGREPLDDYRKINKELKQYSKEVASKPQIIAANKMDLDDSLKNLQDFKKAIKKKIYPISALNREGLEELIEAVHKKL